MSEGIIVAKQGHTIKDTSQFQYVDTQTPLFKLFMNGTGVQNFAGKDLSGAGITFQIPHNLGYIPMFFLYGDRGIGSIRKLVQSIDTQFPENIVLWLVLADTNNLNVTITGGSSVTGTFGYNYYIFYNQVGP